MPSIAHTSGMWTAEYHALYSSSRSGCAGLLCTNMIALGMVHLAGLGGRHPKPAVDPPPTPTTVDEVLRVPDCEDGDRYRASRRRSGPHRRRTAGAVPRLRRRLLGALRPRARVPMGLLRP